MKLLARALVAAGCLAQALFTQVVGFDEENAGGLPEGWTVAMTHTGGAPKWEALKDPTAPSKSLVFAQTSNDPTGSRFPLAIWQRANARDGAVSVKLGATSPLESDVPFHT